MSTDDKQPTVRDRIRAILRDNVEPMRGRDIANALGLEGEKARAPIFSTLTMMADEGLGIERTDDGLYQLVPGWVKGTAAANRDRRNGNAATRVDVPVEAVLAMPTTPMLPKGTPGRPKGAKTKAKREPFRQPVTKAGIEIRANDAPAIDAAPSTVDPRQQPLPGLPVVDLVVANNAANVGVPFGSLETAVLPRRTIRLLVAAVFAGCGTLDEATRAAVREASAVAV
jgi:hypothetical protein